jgi:stringent starvation protein B
MAERSIRPYLIRAIHEWCSDSNLTPYLSVRVDANTRVPAEYVKNGEIVLNVSYDATHKLTIGNEVIQFSARFNGVSRECSVPISAVTGIFARENGQGMSFPREPAQENGNEAPSEPSPTNGNGGKPKLQIIK